MAGLGKATVFVNAELGEFEKALKRAQKMTKDSIGKITNVFDQIGKSTAVAGAAITGAFTAASVKAATFDKGMREVSTLINVSEDEFKALSRQVLDFSSRMGIDAADATNALYEALSAGVPQENVFGFMEVAAKSAIGGVTSVKVSVDGLTSILNAFKIPASEAERVADVMFQTVKIGKTTFDQLASSIANVAPIAAAAGLSFEEVGGAIATLTKQGVKTAEATTQIRAAIQAFLKPGEDMKVVLKAIGAESGEALLKQKGLVGAINAVTGVTNVANKEQNKIAGQIQRAKNQLAEYQNQWQKLAQVIPKNNDMLAITAERKAALTAKIQALQAEINKMGAAYTAAGTSGLQATAEMFGSIEALQAVAALTGENAAGAAADAQAMADAAGVSQEAFNKMKESATQQWNELKASMSAFVITIGLELLPTLKSLFEQMKPVLESVAQWVKENPDLIAQIINVTARVGLLMTALGPMIIAFNQVATSITTTVNVFRLLGALKIIPWITGVIGTHGVSGLLGIVGALGFAVTAGWKLGTWIDEITKNTAFGKWIDGMMDSLVGFVDKLKEWIGLGDKIPKMNMNLPSMQQAAANMKPDVPQFAKGGVMPYDGLAIVGERGPEIVAMREGSRVHDARTSAGMLGGTTIQNLNVAFNGTQFDLSDRNAIRRIARALQNEIQMVTA